MVWSLSFRLSCGKRLDDVEHLFYIPYQCGRGTAPRLAHNQQAVGSNPTRATILKFDDAQWQVGKPDAEDKDP